MNKAIARFVDGLTEEQEDRVLTGKLAIGRFWEQDGTQCLVGRAFGAGMWRGCAETKPTAAEDAVWRVHAQVAHIFDGECFARSVGVVGAEIRQRILDNRAARMPAPQPLECYALAR